MRRPCRGREKRNDDVDDGYFARRKVSAFMNVSYCVAYSLPACLSFISDDPNIFCVFCAKTRGHSRQRDHKIWGDGPCLTVGTCGSRFNSDGSQAKLSLPRRKV